jgi:anti-sigma regulatory factor (Ser/Thr protein kinase)
MEWRERVVDASQIRRLRAKLGESLRRAGADECKISDAELVLTELVSNGLRYGTDTANVALYWIEGAPVIDVQNSGPPIDLNAPRSGDLRESGRGLAIVRSLARQFDVVRIGITNHARAVLALNGGD